ncbi:hypothetical protein PBY51_018455 [Eleginops maclovinus]|uniref:DHHA2 domain-containing protein n=1 Tax=Eleginops maclovinus TaxID=56733 RepID=A0AAN7Y6R2_ELEMC|nr:hypothetical protein PBY51_018455 [Eleginops maclovinus]
MEAFLTSCCRAVKENQGGGPGFHVVLGNEACDLDSMVCALTYAYFLSKSSGEDQQVVPLLNIKRVEFPLRSDSIFLLQQLHLSADLLLFRDQLDLQDLNRAGRLRLTLVDHNVLPSLDSDLEGAVVQVIDHHLLERRPSPSCHVTVEMVGSCATLVTERILQEAPQILDLQVAHMIYAAVLLDCVNLCPSAGKVTPQDSAVAAELQVRFPDLPQREDLFQRLQDAKFSVSVLISPEYQLASDGLSLPQFGVTQSPKWVPALKDFLQGAELEAELSAFCLKFGFDFLLLMTISFSERQQPIRELAVFSHSNTYRQQVGVYLEQACSPALQLCPIRSPHPHISAYQQGNTLASRKKLLPLVKDFLSERERVGFHGDAEEESRFPPTPMNSLVDGCPLDGGGPPTLSAQDLQDQFSRMADSDL